MYRDRTQVVIIGSGPAGQLLGHVLNAAGIDTVILERRSRSHVLSRIRAGVLEPASVDFLRDYGPATRIATLGRKLEGVDISWENRGTLKIDVLRWTGRHMTVYGQTFLTEDLIAARGRSGAPLVNEVEDLTIHQADSNAPFVTYTTAGKAHRLDCQIVAGCDGAQGVSAETIPASLGRAVETAYGIAWVGIMVERPPIDEIVYMQHSDGFALATQRTKELSRYYVQAAATDHVEDWSDDRFWETFVRRAPRSVVDRLKIGPSVEKSIAVLRNRRTQTLRWGRLFLAGDAAHIVPPTGAKGLNLAISDVSILSRAIIAFLLSGDASLIDRYPEMALRRIGAAQNLSARLTKLLHRFPGETPEDTEKRNAEFDRLLRSEHAQEQLAQSYSGGEVVSPLTAPDPGPRQ